MWFLRKEEPKRGAMAVDWDNLILGLDPDKVNEALIINGFDRTVKRISREFGEIVVTFVFLPLQAAYTWGETIHKLGFWPIVCPRVKSKEEGKEIDTVDQSLIRLTNKMINEIKDLSFFCLVSGDRDFSLLLRQIMQRGMKIVVVAPSLRSLSGKLVPPLSDKVYMFELSDSE